MAEISRRGIILAVGGGAASLAVAGFVLPRTRSSSSPTRRREARTSFGSIVLLGSSRLVAARVGAASHGRHHGDHGHDVSGIPVASAVHGAWTDAVLVEVEVHNDLSRAMELSPGQFRVRVADGGPTVSLYSADRDAGAVAAGSTTTMRIHYLAPPPDRALSLEFADPGATGPVLLGRLQSG
jgi:hypothetical protein